MARPSIPQIVTEFYSFCIKYTRGTLTWNSPKPFKLKFKTSTFLQGNCYIQFSDRRMYNVGHGRIFREFCLNPNKVDANPCLLLFPTAGCSAYGCFHQIGCKGDTAQCLPKHQHSPFDAIFTNRTVLKYVLFAKSRKGLRN